MVKFVPAWVWLFENFRSLYHSQTNGILIDTEAIYLHFIIKQNVSVQDELLTYILFETEEEIYVYTLIK